MEIDKNNTFKVEVFEQALTLGYFGEESFERLEKFLFDIYTIYIKRTSYTEAGWYSQIGMTDDMLGIYDEFMYTDGWYFSEEKKSWIREDDYMYYETPFESKIVVLMGIVDIIYGENIKRICQNN